MQSKPVQVLKHFFASISMLVLLAGFTKGKDPVISLQGTWRFKIDSADVGIKEKWFSTKLGESIKLPGSMAENLKGNDITLHTKWTGSIYDSSWYYNPRFAKYRRPGHLKIPFWLTPAKHYVGPAWYQKEVLIPQSWKDKRIVLFLERAHTETRIWVDNAEIGMQNSMVAPHQYDLSESLKPGKHTISIRIDNRIKDINVGPDSHSLTDHTQGNWNGIIGKMQLTAGSAVYLDDVQVYPDLKNKQAKVKMAIRSINGINAAGIITLSAESFNTKTHQQIKAIQVNFAVKNGMDSVTAILPMGDHYLTWDEFNPALYRLTATLKTRNGLQNEKQVQFGMREFKTSGRQFTINGRPVFLRGTVENCVFPLTGYPDMDVTSWQRIFKIAKSYGLNHMRFHSWCPPEAAFIAADLAGFYLQPEGPSWANHGSALGYGKPIDQFIYDETNRMAKSYGNYASFCMMAYGNEPRGRQVEYLTQFNNYWKAKDSRRIYTGASVGGSWPVIPNNEYMVRAGARGLDWVNHPPESVSDYREKIAQFHVPFVAHEMGQYCVFPDFKEIKKYTGVYRARNFELFQEDLKDHFMADEADSFLMASGKLQALCYKNEIEKALRTPGYSGFQLLSLNDYPGQGTALVGVLNAFWDEKGYINAKEFSRFCNSTVPLARIPKFVYQNDETFNADIEIAHYGKAPLKNAHISWRIKDAGGALIAHGEFESKTLPVGNCISVGKVDFPLTGIKKAVRLNLEVSINDTSFANDWNFWVYPAKLPEVKTNVYYCTSLDKKAEEVLNNGGSVFLNAAGKVVKGKEVVQHFLPVFWNTSWFKMRPPHTLGILLNPAHPAFTDFPTSYHSDLQWWAIVNKAQVMNLEDFPKDFRPLVQPIDTWFMNRRLALIFEANVGSGKIIVSSANLSQTDPAARQLYYSIQRYMQSDKFKPAFTLDFNLIKDIFETGSKQLFDTYTKDSPDELKPSAKFDNPKQN